MDLSFLQNPIVLAILAAALSYLYLYLEHKNKQAENPKAEIDPISYTIPAVIGLGTFFVAYMFFGRNKLATPEDIVNEQLGGGNLMDQKFTDGVSAANDSFGSNTFKLVGKNSIKLPQTDVFIDLAHF
jgi:hypothetical protein